MILFPWVRAASLAAVLSLGACASMQPQPPAPAPAVVPPVAATAPAVTPSSAQPKAATKPSPKPAQTATLTVTIDGVLPQKSMLLVGLFDAKSYAALHPPYHHDETAKSPETVITFTDVKPGRYAVKILQDLNGNHVVDKTLIGVPEEPFGLSNDVKPNLSEPGFEETSFQLKPGANAIVIHMQQM